MMGKSLGRRKRKEDMSFEVPDSRAKMGRSSDGAPLAPDEMKRCRPPKNRQMEERQQEPREEPLNSNPPDPESNVQPEDSERDHDTLITPSKNRTYRRKKGETGQCNYDLSTPDEQIQIDKMTFFALKKKLTSLEADNSSLRSVIASLEDEKARLTEEYASGNEEIDCLKEERNTLKAELTSLKEERNTLKAENTSLKEDRNTLKAENTSLKEDRNTLKAENTCLKRNSCSLAKKCTSMTHNYSSLKKKYNRRKEELTSIQRDYFPLAWKHIKLHEKHLEYVEGSKTTDFQTRVIHTQEVEVGRSDARPVPERGFCDGECGRPERMDEVHATDETNFHKTQYTGEPTLDPQCTMLRTEGDLERPGGEPQLESSRKTGFQIFPGLQLAVASEKGNIPDGIKLASDTLTTPCKPDNYSSLAADKSLKEMSASLSLNLADLPQGTMENDLEISACDVKTENLPRMQGGTRSAQTEAMSDQDVRRENLLNMEGAFRSDVLTGDKLPVMRAVTSEQVDRVKFPSPLPVIEEDLERSESFSLERKEREAFIRVHFVTFADGQQNNVSNAESKLQEAEVIANFLTELNIDQTTERWGGTGFYSDDSVTPGSLQQAVTAVVHPMRIFSMKFGDFLERIWVDPTKLQSLVKSWYPHVHFAREQDIRTYALKASINKAFFRDFLEEDLTQYFHHSNRTMNFQGYVQIFRANMGALDTDEAFATFRENKFRCLAKKFELPGADEDINAEGLLVRLGGQQLYADLSSVLKNLWLLQITAFCFVNVVHLLWFMPKSAVKEALMKSVNSDEETDQRELGIGFTVTPGFCVEKSVIKAEVYTISL